MLSYKYSGLSTMFAALAFCSSALLPATNAQACSPPPEGLVPSFQSPSDDLIPAGGAWAFRASIYVTSIPIADLSITAQTQDGAIVPGQMHIIDADGKRVTGDQLAPSFNYQNYLFTWAPDEPFTQETTLKITVRQAPGVDGSYRMFDEEQIQVTFAGEPIPQGFSAAPEITIDELQTREVDAGYECCFDPTMGGMCTLDVCWPTRYEYLPAIYLLLQTGTKPASSQFYHVLTTTNDQRTFLWNHNNDQPLMLTYLQDSCEASCYTVTTYALNTGEKVAESSGCVQPDEFPEYTPRELVLTGDERPDTCEDDNWRRDPDDQERTRCPRTPGTDTPHPGSNNDATTLDDRGCGCASARQTPGSLLAFALGCGIMLWRRRR